MELYLSSTERNTYSNSLKENTLHQKKIENIYITHPAIAQTFVYGESLRTTLIGMVFPDPEGGFVNWAARSGFKGMDFETLCTNEEVVAKLLSEMRDVGKGS